MTSLFLFALLLQTAEPIQAYEIGVAAGSATLWSTTVAVAGIACNQPVAAVAASPIVLTDAVTVVFDDPQTVGKQCVGPAIRPVLPVCTTTPCPLYTVRLRAVGSTLASAWTVALPSITPSLQVGGADPLCVAPLGAEAASIFVTRWEPISGKVPRPGAEARVNYKLASKSPIRSIAVKVNGAVVRQQTGTDVDLASSGGMWFTVPATAGSYKLSVAVTNVYCPTPREVLSPVDLVVR